MMDTYSVSQGRTVLGVVTGKPLSLGGSLGRAGSTSQGIVHVASLAMSEQGLPPQSTVAVQGFGKVGRGVARFLAQRGACVVAVSDQFGAVHAAGGLDVPALERHMDAAGTVVGFSSAEPLEDKDLLLELDVDILVPSAVEGVIHEGNADGVKAKIIVEGANGPITSVADALLEDRGVLVVPDILANAGGVVVSYFEWAQANQTYWWTEDEVQQRLEERMFLAWLRVGEYARQENVTLRLAATALAVASVAEAHKLRGLYP